MSYGNEETVEIEVEVQRVTEKAMLVLAETGDEVWIPKSQMREGTKVAKEGDSGVMVITRWIATEKGLV